MKNDRNNKQSLTFSGSNYCRHSILADNFQDLGKINWLLFQRLRILKSYSHDRIIWLEKTRNRG